MIRWNNDYNHGAHPAILAALQDTNGNSYGGYGLDEWCEKARQMILSHLGGADAEVHFLLGGTQANFTVINAALRPYQGVVCADSGHIHAHETGAIEHGGHKIHVLPGTLGKLTAEAVAADSSRAEQIVALEAEKEIIREETRAIVDKCFELGMGDIAVGVCRGVEAGVLDVPFAPCRANAGLMLPARDNDGAVRILNFGNLPFSKELKDFHIAKIEERANYEKRKASFQMVIDDVYAIGKGYLVGRPR